MSYSGFNSDSKHDSVDDEHDMNSLPPQPSQLRKELSSQLSSKTIPLPSSHVGDALPPVDSPALTSSSSPTPSLQPKHKPAPRLSTTRARATSAFFATSTLDPECGEKMRPSLILGLLFFRRALSPDMCRDILTQRLAQEYQRFRSKVVVENHAICFQELPLAELNMHYHCQEVQATGWTQSDLDAFLSSQYKVSKPSDAPLWIFYVLNDLADGRSCLVANIDHCIGDGITMVQVLMSLLDDRHPESPASPLRPSETPTGSAQAQGEAHSQAEALAASSSILPKHKSSDNSQPTPRSGRPSSSGRSGYNHISVAEKTFVFLRGVVWGVVGSVLPGDTPNPLKLVDPRVPGLQRTCSFGDKISLQQVKQIKNKFPGTTVNDILSAVLNMAVQRYYEEECPGFIASRPLVRALFPINMRRKAAQVGARAGARAEAGVDMGGGSSLALGNCFSSGVYQFLFNYKTRTELVWQVKRQVDLIKISPQPLVELFFLSTLFPLLSRSAIIDLTLTTLGKFTMTLSNVPGPQTVAHFGGQEIDDLSFVACSPIGLYCGLLSYNGKVSCGLCSDPSAEAEPEKVTRYWKQEFDALYAETMAHEGDVPQPRAGLWHRHGFTIVSMLLLSAAISWHISPLTALGST